MSLSCLSCQFMDGNTSDPENECNCHKVSGRLYNVKVERSWSGNIPPSPSPYKKMRNKCMNVKVKVMKTVHYPRYSTGSIEFKGNNDEPKLVRSCGMRRDWSFEDLIQGDVNEERKS